VQTLAAKRKAARRAVAVAKFSLRIL